MSDDNNNDDDIEGKKLNPSFHDLINSPEMNGPVNNKNLNPTLEDAINKDNETPPIKAKGSNDSNTPRKKVGTISDNSREDNMRTRYYALRIIATFFQIFAFIVGIAGIGISIGEANRIKLFVIVGIIGSIIAFIVLLASSEMIKLFIDIEANTRATKINTRHKNT
jgi:hypothetical protein